MIYMQGLQLFNRFRCRGGVEACPFHLYRAVWLFDRDAGYKTPVATPKAANGMLAIVENLGVSVTACDCTRAVIA
jgi:hypothetical protein